MDNKTQLLKRVAQMEVDLAELKSELQPPPKKGFVGRSQRAFKFMLSNWGFFAFLITLSFAGWAYFRYGVGYFETQKNLSLTKRSSEFYRQLGDKLILNGELAHAEDAYSKALKINGSNIEATRGLLKTQVFQPREGQKYIIPEVVDIKIGLLATLLGDQKKDTYIIPYLKGARYEDQEKYVLAKQFYEESISDNPDFIYGYIALAYVSILAGDGVDIAIPRLERALKIDGNSAVALNNLGYCHMVKLDFPKALKLFEQSQQSSPYLETFINFGDAYLYLGEPDKALVWHLKALKLVNDKENEEEPGVAGSMAINFMPAELGDKTTPQDYVKISSFDEKQSLVFFSLALDHAKKGDLKTANKQFDSAMRIGPSGDYRRFLQNKLKSFKRFTKKPLSNATESWLLTKSRILEKSAV